MLKHIFRPTAQTGSTMLEVLISIVVLSFGLLGMLGLIINGLKMTTTSNYRSIAAEQLTAIAETINAAPWDRTSVYVAAASSTSTPSCFTTGCTKDQVPPTEYGLWQQRVSNSLPSGQGTVSAASNGRPLVTICWDESNRVSVSRTSSTVSATCFSAQL